MKRPQGPVRRQRSRRNRHSQEGQSLVELSVVVPVILLILLGILELGFAFDHQITLGYASREGARLGSALANGGGTLGCGSGQSPNAGAVDQNVIGAVERVLTASGSPIKMSNIGEIDIYKSKADGSVSGSAINVWNWSSSGTAQKTSGSLTAPAIHFVLGSVGWNACGRTNVAPADSIGVRIRYTYQAVTPLAGILRFFGGGGWSSLPITDQTVMALNPTN